MSIHSYVERVTATVGAPARRSLVHTDVDSVQRDCPRSVADDAHIRIARREWRMSALSSSADAYFRLHSLSIRYSFLYKACLADTCLHVHFHTVGVRPVKVNHE